jgi:general secretion pathway protein D
MQAVDESDVPFDDRIPLVFNRTPQSWNDLTKSRRALARDGRTRRSEKEIEIEQRLKTPVSLKFREAPLSQVMDYLAKLAQVNLHLDPRGLAEEGVTSETPITIDLSQDISLKSALNLILQPLHLSFVIKDEVLKVTSEQLRDGEVYQKVYSVGDLVIPIPMFTPNGRMGLAGALHDAQSSLRPGGVGSFGADAPLAVVASNTGAQANGVIDPRVLAQMGAAPGAGFPGGFIGGPLNSGGPPGTGVPQSFGFASPGGPGGLGGGAQPDFASLIQLITSTIQPTTWDENGGPGAIYPHFNNLSLVVSQTQQVHEEIEELLQQLRRLQDLQVTVEVRFITLNDNFFERIGIDFDFNINDNLPPDKAAPAGLSSIDTLVRGQPGEDLKHRLRQDITVGMSLPGIFSSNLDIPFRQNSFLLSRPQFGGFDPAAGASLGFAILSDLEAFFFIEAAQGDRRSNVLQAPKVTLFNGQSAFVSDTSQSPFVISVIPVVGDFAAAQQPVIVVLSEGTFLTVQAVVSNDKRFVRLTIVPFFSNIGDVNQFTFTGSSTSTEDESSEGQVDGTTGRTTKKTTSMEGTTVQLPTFSFVTVTTTVSVPDGGTVLLGGIKRLSEGRNEFGVPILNKIPYINRLFSNVGIGRETQSLMMMVTPRIIIQEEEEANLTGQQPPP